MDMQARLLYPVKEAASILGVERTTLYKLIDSGQVERVKIGRRTLITSNSLAEYVGRLRQGSAA